MKTGTDDKRKRIAAIALGSLAGLLVVYQLYNLFGGPSSTAPPTAAPVIVNASTAKGAPNHTGPAAEKIGTTSAQLDPTLHMEPMLVTESLVYSGAGRNIFSGTIEAPVLEADNQKSTFKARPCPPDCPPPPPPPPPPATCPPTCAPINLKFFGTATSPNGTRRAFLLNGDDVFVASVGDVVQRRYRVVSIAANSVFIEDIPNSNKQTLPLTGN
jgi:hypothetical protein